MVPVPANRLARLSLAALVATAATVALSLAACASTGSLRAARGAESTQNYDVAVAEYAKLLRDNPNDREARLGLERSRLRAAQDHFSRARRDAAAGKVEEAMAEYQLAAELNPGNADVERELQATRTQLRAIFSELLTRAPSLEVGEPLPMVSSIINGVKRMPFTL